jgi:hypothetical protein
MKQTTFMTTHQENRMKRLTLLLLGSVLIAGSACADPDISILITGHAPLEGTLDEETGLITDCTIPEQIGEGIYYSDVFINLADASGTGFALGILMENQLVDSSSYAPIGEDQNQRLNQNHIEIQGYEMTFDSGESGFNTLGSSGDIRYEATGILPTDGTLWAGVVLFYPNEVSDWQDAFQIASGGQSSAIVPTFAEFQVKGRTVGGSNVESNKLTIPIQVCDGCSRPSTPLCVASQ